VCSGGNFGSSTDGFIIKRFHFFLFASKLRRVGARHRRRPFVHLGLRLCSESARIPRSPETLPFSSSLESSQMPYHEASPPDV
jgi:hypothetical protein